MNIIYTINQSNNLLLINYKEILIKQIEFSISVNKYT